MCSVGIAKEYHLGYHQRVSIAIQAKVGASLRKALSESGAAIQTVFCETEGVGKNMKPLGLRVMKQLHTATAVMLLLLNAPLGHAQAQAASSPALRSRHKPGGWTTGVSLRFHSGEFRIRTAETFLKSSARGY